jgi:hypothetical protein
MKASQVILLRHITAQLVDTRVQGFHFMAYCHVSNIPTQTLEIYCSGTSDRIHAVLGLFGSPCLALYSYQIS